MATDMDIDILPRFTMETLPIGSKVKVRDPKGDFRAEERFIPGVVHSWSGSEHVCVRCQNSDALITVPVNELEIAPDAKKMCHGLLQSLTGNAFPSNPK